MAGLEPVRIRVAGPADAERCAAIYGPIVSGTIISMEEAAPDGRAMAARMEATLATHPWLVAGHADAVLGYAYAAPHRSRAGYRWAVDVSAYVAEDARGRGVGRALYERLIRLLRAQGFLRAYAGVALPNPASIALHEGLGFRPVGVYRGVGFKLGRWIDVGWWELPLGDSDAAPPEPIAFPALRRRPDFDELIR